MVEKADTILGANDRGAGDAAPAAPVPVADIRPEHTKIKGRFNQYVSAFWTFVLPLFTTRYLFQPLFNMMGWTDDARAIAKREERLGLESGKKQGIAAIAREGRYPILQRSFAIVTGAVMFLATAFYSLKTLGDMRRTLSESIAYEMGKDPKNVNMIDLLFRKTDDDVLNKVRRNFFKYTARRLGLVVLPFFSFFIPPLSKRLSTEDAVRWGIGFGASYLVSDVLTRKETFFEELQAFTDRKINQIGRVGEQVTATDLINLYELNARDHSPQTTFSDKINTPLWKQNVPVFERMAELMNNTYHPGDGGKSDFTIPKFVYMVGHKLIQPEKPQETLVYVEIANRYGIPAVKRVAAAIKGGAKLEEVLKQFPPQASGNTQETVENQQDTGKFTGKLAGETRGATRPGPAPSSSYTEKTAKNDVPAAGVAV